MTDEERLARKREWARKYYQSHKAELLAREKEYYRAHPEKRRKKNQRFKAKHPDYAKEYYQAHKEHIRELSKDWYKNKCSLKRKEQKEKNISKFKAENPKLYILAEKIKRLKQDKL